MYIKIVNTRKHIVTSNFSLHIKDSCYQRYWNHYFLRDILFYRGDIPSFILYFYPNGDFFTNIHGAFMGARWSVCGIWTQGPMGCRAGLELGKDTHEGSQDALMAAGLG